MSPRQRDQTPRRGGRLDVKKNVTFPRLAVNELVAEWLEQQQKPSSQGQKMGA
jgi:hypothetical protein